MTEKDQNMANWNLMYVAKTTGQRVQYLNPLAWELETNFMKKLIFLAQKYFFSENVKFGSPVFGKKSKLSIATIQMTDFEFFKHKISTL